MEFVVGKSDEVVARVSWEQALAWRMRRQYLLERTSPADLLTVVERMCGVHAQVMSSAELTLWARIDGLAREVVQDALWKRRVLVKLWAMRGTLHLVPAPELGLWLAGLGTYKHYGMMDEVIVDLAETVGRALDDELLTRKELAMEVERLSGSAAMGELVHGSWGSYLKSASFLGRLCFGPSEGQRVRFTHPASWVPGEIEEPDPSEALAAIMRRYLGAYAPATVKDFAGWWAGGRTREAKQMLAALGEEAVAVNVEGERYWMLAKHVPEMSSTEPENVVRLLPGFDQWVVCASRHAPALLDPEHKSRVYRQQGWISPVLLVNGRMDGVWRHRRKGKRLLVEVEPFGKLSGWARDQTEAEAVRLAEFLGGELELNWQE